MKALEAVFVVKCHECKSELEYHYRDTKSGVKDVCSYAGDPGESCRYLKCPICSREVEATMKVKMKPSLE